MSGPRERILRTAADLFTERGFECVGINEIITKAEVAKASFYQHFPSKTDLCAAWLREEQFGAEARQAALLAADRPVEDTVSEFYRFMEEWLETHHFRGCPFCTTASMTGAGEESHAVIRDSRAASRRFWHDLARKTGASPRQAGHLGDAWFLLATGAMAEAQASRSPWPLASARRTAHDLAAAARTSSAQKK